MSLNLRSCHQRSFGVGKACKELDRLHVVVIVLANNPPDVRKAPFSVLLKLYYSARTQDYCISIDGLASLLSHPRV